MPTLSWRRAVRDFGILSTIFVLVTHDFREVFPVDAAETPANAEALRSRLAFLRGEIIPHINADPIE